MKRFTTLVTSSILAAGLFLQPAIAALPVALDGEKMPSLAPMLKEVTPGVVTISVAGTQRTRQRVPEMFRYFFGPGAPREQVQEKPFQGMGSGVIINAEEGYVVTNNHVIANADEITVTLKNGEEHTAKKVGVDEESDIALLKIDAEDLIEVKIADSDKLEVGDFVVAIGNPFGLSQTVTTGIVSALGRSGLNIEGLENFIQTDAAINRGNSGGALVNLRGELVGINTAIYGPNGGNVGIGFAIPGNMMQNLINQIIEYGEVRRGLLGIRGRNLDSDLAEAMELETSQGAWIDEVSEESAAEEGGLKAGDIIVSVNGTKLKSFDELRARISTLGAGAKVKLGIIRDGDNETINVTLKEADSGNVAAVGLHPALEGATLSSSEEGVSVTAVEERSQAAARGLEVDDLIIGVNRKRVDSVADLRKLMDDAKGVIALNIKRGRSSLYLVIR